MSDYMVAIWRETLLHFELQALDGWLHIYTLQEMPFLLYNERWTQPLRQGVQRIRQCYQWISRYYHSDIDTNDGIAWYLVVLLHLVIYVIRFFPALVLVGEVLYHLSPFIAQIYQESTLLFMAQDWMVLETFLARSMRR